MKKIFLKLFVFIATMGLTTSCNFLDLKPVHEYVDNDMLKTYDDALAAVNGVYTNLLEGGDEYAGSQYITLSARAGFIKNSYETIFEEKTSLSSTSGIYNMWEVAYKGINYANFAIKGIEGMKADVFKDEAKRVKLLGEARLLRAWYCINLLYHYAQWWAVDSSPYGIIWREDVSVLDNLDVARSTVGESYAKIIADLDYAIANCPTLDEFKSNRKMSKEYAKVLKAKLLLIRGTSPARANEQDLKDALALVEDLFAHKPSGWVMESDMAEMYNNSFDSKENLFVRYNQDWAKTQRNGGYSYGYGISYIASVANNQVLTSEGKPYPYDESKFDAGFLPKNLDWIKADPRWKITTGVQDNAETWDLGTRFTVKKLYRNGFNSTAAKKPHHGVCDGKFNVYYFRLYELYLLKAELILRTGGTAADALTVVNSVRAMRTNPILPALEATSKEQVYTIIYKEIFNELYMENGSEYYASLRFNSPDGDKYVEYNKKGEDVVVNMLKHIFPIPAGEVANNKLMIQNEGY